MNTAMSCDLREARILLIEQQPVVAADIEDRLAEAGAFEIAILRSAKKEFDPRDYDVLILNASQEREEARRLVRLALDGGCKIIILHDDIAKAGEMFPGIPVVEIPFDSQEILAAVCRSLGQSEKV
jgi:DNA-binding LacI/PurR family transcriptional regulator